MYSNVLFLFFINIHVMSLGAAKLILMPKVVDIVVSPVGIDVTKLHCNLYNFTHLSNT